VVQVVGQQRLAFLEGAAEFTLPETGDCWLYIRAAAAAEPGAESKTGEFAFSTIYVRENAPRP